MTVGLGLFLIGGTTAWAQQGFTSAWSTYVGSEYGTERVYAVAADSHTNLYLAGYLEQGLLVNADDIAAVGGISYKDGFVAKLSSDGSLVKYFCLGNENDPDNPVDNNPVKGLAVFTNDQMYAVVTSARTSEFSANEDTGTDAQLFIINGQTDAVTPADPIGAINSTNGFNAVAVDSNGYVYAVGYTMQTGLTGTAPVTGYTVNGVTYGTAPKGGTDALVAKYTPAGALVWAFYLGGTNDDAATACALGADDSVYVAGTTRSPGWTTLPSGATPNTNNVDGFIAKLTPSGTHVWSSLLGGSAADTVASLAKDRMSGALIVGGASASTDFLTGATYLNSRGGGTDGFAVKLTDTGTALQTNWCRFFGGSASDTVSCVTLLSNGRVAVGGTTASSGWLTQTQGSTFKGVQDGFLSVLDSAGTVAWSAYVGGEASDTLYALTPYASSLLTGGSTFSTNWISGGFQDTWIKMEDFPSGFAATWISEGSAPSITTQPANLTVLEGSPASFSVTAQGTAPLTYRWFRNGSLVATLTTNRYTLASAAVTNNNDAYTCLVSNYFGTVMSDAATLTVTAKGTLTVTLAPAAAVSQGAQWSFDSGTTWLASGGSTNLAPGTYTVSFKSLTGWTAPAALDTTVVSASTTATSGVYTAILPSAIRSITGTNVTVVVQAPDGVSTWTQVETLPAALTPTVYSSGGSWNSSAHTLTFTGVENKTVTNTYTVSCQTSGIYTVSGTVTPLPAGVSVTVSGATQIERVNFKRVINGTSVTIIMYQPTSSKNWNVSDFLPVGVGLSVTNIIGLNGDWDPDGGEVYWYGRSVAQTLSYEVLGPSGTYSIWGHGTINSVEEAVFGDTLLIIPDSNGGGSVTNVPSPDILSLIPVNNTTYTLTFTSVVSRTYLILTNATVTATNAWAECLSVPGSAGTTQQQVPAAGARLFYRIRVQE